jgi:hypothetical protein
MSERSNGYDRGYGGANGNRESIIHCWLVLRPRQTAIPWITLTVLTAAPIIKATLLGEAPGTVQMAQAPQATAARAPQEATPAANMGSRKNGKIGARGFFLGKSATSD